MQRGKPFQKGMSGNPAGKPKGARHKATRAVEALLDGEAEALTRKAIEKALGGDTVALRLCLDRLCPPRKSRPIDLDLPPSDDAFDASKFFDMVMRGVADGEVTPDEAGEVAKLIEAQARIREMSEFEQRLKSVEERINARKP
jgi:hypothetical protein